MLKNAGIYDRSFIESKTPNRVAQYLLPELDREMDQLKKKREKLPS
jgi:hypothetical protein